MKRQEIFASLQNGIQHSYQGKVIVVGAGIAGISATQILRKSGVEVLLLEASNQYGGRIRSSSDFAHTPIELGAEEVHGSRNVWYDIIKSLEKELVEYDQIFDEYYFVDNQLQSYEQIQHDRHFQKALALQDKIGNFTGEDISLKTFVEQNIDTQFQFALEAWFSASYGTSLQNLSMESISESYNKWSSGERNFIFAKDSYISVVEDFFAEVLPIIQFNQVVSQINYSENQVEAMTTAGENFLADSIILTVPLRILQKNKITFSPDLPIEKQKAIQTIGIDTGMKILLKFQNRFWAEYAGAIYGQGYIPEFYSSAKDDEPILTAYVMGDKAKYLSDLGEDAIYVALHELDILFGERMASKLFVEARIIDWGKEPFIEGCYSYASKGSDKARKILAEPIENKLYFAGEACNINGHHATVQGAIESAYKATLSLLANV